MVPWYTDTSSSSNALTKLTVAFVTKQYLVERVQTGVRLEKRLLQVLKALAQYHNVSLGDLIEGIVLHAFEGKSALGPESQQRVAALKRVYGLDLDADASHQLYEVEASAPAPKTAPTSAAPTSKRKRVAAR